LYDVVIIVLSIYGVKMNLENNVALVTGGASGLGRGAV
jgi:hypothetical protein